MTMTADPAPPPPPYTEETTRGQDLQASFAQLTRQHGEIRGLFMKVATELEASPKIGGEHQLAKEWDELSKKHKRLYRDSQQNASTCASFLKHYADVLIPLSNGQATAEVQRTMITNFKETIPVNQRAAKQISEDFDDLAKDVELFPAKVERVLKESEGGFFQRAYSGVEWLFTTIWKALQKLFNSIIDAFRSVLSCVQKMGFSCGPFVKHMSFNTAPRTPSVPEKSMQEEIGDMSTQIAEKLTGFEDAWHLMRIACDDLQRNVERADFLSSMPGSFHAYIQPSEIQGAYHPMVLCMEAYARGKLL